MDKYELKLWLTRGPLVILSCYFLLSSIKIEIVHTITPDSKISLSYRGNIQSENTVTHKGNTGIYVDHIFTQKY